MLRFLKHAVTLVLVGCFLAAAAAAWYVYTPLEVKLAPGEAAADLHIDAGTSANGVAQAVVASGAQTSALVLGWWFRLSGQARQIKAGSYELVPGSSPAKLLSMLVRGDQSLKTITLVEGWNFNQVLKALQKEEHLRHDLSGLAPDLLMNQLGRAGVHPEGRFFPDTYSFAKGSLESSVLKRAAHAMDKRLEAAWAQRSADTPLKSAEQALILASIVEKETGLAADRGQIAGVFSNRLRSGMLLQTDPTVIYGIGPRFNGNLRKRDLLQDTPYNTYTRAGLPPTPIAMPGRAALIAAVQPERTSALYFVARGDGSSQFSSTLDEHNRAVNKFIRGR